jgi:hypothetical protein
MVHNLLERIVSRRSILIASTLALAAGIGLGYGLWYSPMASPLSSAQSQCPPPNSGALCPEKFTFLAGQVDVTTGVPYVILFSAGLPTSTTGIFYENGHYGYQLYLPVDEAFFGGTTTTVNGTTYSSGSVFPPITYHVTMRYFLGNMTSRTCTPQPSTITLTLSEFNQQSFSC